MKTREHAVSIPGRPGFRIIRGGEPTPEQLAAIAVSLEVLAAPSISPEEQSAVPTSSEWALAGRMENLHWEPLCQRWPGETPGMSWRRAAE